MCVQAQASSVRRGHSCSHTTSRSRHSYVRIQRSASFTVRARVRFRSARRRQFAEVTTPSKTRTARTAQFHACVRCYASGNAATRRTPSADGAPARSCAASSVPHRTRDAFPQTHVELPSNNAASTDRCVRRHHRFARFARSFFEGRPILRARLGGTAGSRIFSSSLNLSLMASPSAMHWL